jgi:hypothetical protein
MYQIPNFTEPINPERIEVRTLRIDFVPNLIQIEVAFITQSKTFIHTSDLIPFDGDWQNLDVQSLMNSEIAKFAV